MERLSGADATFIYTQTRRTPAEIGTCLILDTSDDPDGLERLATLRARMLAKMHQVPRMRMRYQRVPFDVHHPAWVDDDRFDIDYHVRQAQLPGPGTREQLLELLDRLLSSPLDNSRPLWEMYLISGLEHGRSVLFIKTHHASVDGMSGFQLLTTLVDLAPEPEDIGAPEPWTPARRPGSIGMLWNAGIDHLKDPLAVPRGVARLTTDLASTLFSTRSASEVLGASMAPQSPFNRKLSSRRFVRFFELDLAGVLAVKNAAGVKVNDVAIGLIGGGLRRHLERIGHPTDPSLVTYLPVTLGTGAETAGNKTTVVSARVGTDEPDAAARIASVAAQTKEAKERAAVNNPPLILDVASVAGPAFGAALERLAVATRVTEIFRLAGNLAISNVASIAFPLFSLGAPVEEIYPIGPISDGMGLNFTLLTYRDKVRFSMVTDPTVIADPDSVIEDCLTEWESMRAKVLG
ncbi:MAG: wax ester/triacylglycerol synthase family O-acyltransferase [Nocardioides sp.]|jgi:diacylglycerol O-acyltransferase